MRQGKGMAVVVFCVSKTRDEVIDISGKTISMSVMRVSFVKLRLTQAR